MPDATALGVDLGTTLSVVAQVSQAGVPVVLPNAQGAPTTPSVVYFDGRTAVVGDPAKDALGTEPEAVVQLVKRNMGADWTFDYDGVGYRPEHVSALILRKLHQDAELITGPVTQAAVTVPAYFNDPMRYATRRAAELAGLDVVGLLSEPTAAALAFGFDRRPAGATGVVVDLGGGTFDVTVMDFDGHDLTVTLPFKLPVAHAPLLLISTGAQLLFVLLAFLLKPGGLSWQLGAYLSLLAALTACGVIALPAIQSMQGTQRPGT